MRRLKEFECAMKCIIYLLEGKQLEDDEGFRIHFQGKYIANM